MVKTTTYRTHRSRASLVAQHTVLRNTYFLLGLTLLFSGAMAFLGMVLSNPINPLISFIGMIGLLYAVQYNANNSLGLLLTFAFTGFMGYTLGPMLSIITHSFANGGAIITVSAATTGCIFLGLSTYVLTTKKDFSFMGGMLFVMLLGGILLSLFAMLTAAPVMFLVVNALMILVFSGLIMYHTSEILHGGERNYILATISLYLALYNLFIYLLQIFMIIYFKT